jgi:hypothetical protein
MICIAENSGGKGGVAGGAGAQGQASQSATGTAAIDYGYPVIEVVTGMTTTQQVQLTKDYDGTIPSDLSVISSVKFRAVPSMVSTSKVIETDCAFTANGVVTLTLTPDDVNYNNGVWYAEFLCYSGDDLFQNYRAYLCIRKGTTGSTHGPHTITAMDVRLALMDTSAEANQLLDDLEFSDMMIYNAVERCIDEWNETPPELARKFDATSFPYREHLIKGAVGYLMQAIAYRYTRNRMQYSASGLSLDSSDKGPQYIQLAQMARQEWKNFIAAKKTELNMGECFGTVELPYFGNGWY